MEFNKVLLSLVLVNGVLVNSLQAKPVNLDTDLNRLVAEYGPVNSTAPIDKETVFNLVEASAETTDPVQSNAASAMVRAQISGDTTLAKVGTKRTSEVALSTDEVNLVKEALDPAKTQDVRRVAAKKLKMDTKSAPVSAPATPVSMPMGSASGSAPVVLTPEQQTLKANVEHGGSVYYADDLRQQFAILEDPRSSAADRQRAADLIAVSQIVGNSQIKGNRMALGNLDSDVLFVRPDGATQFLHAALNKDASEDQLKALIRLGVDPKKAAVVNGDSRNAAKYARLLGNSADRIVMIERLMAN